MQESITNQRAVTIQDIAASAGVSPTTVSMVLNGKAAQYRICTATRQRVEAVIAQSGYQPNRVARNMRLGRGTLVGLILAEGTPDVGELMAGLEPVLAGAGYSLVVVSGGSDPAIAGERIRRLNHDGLAGLIYGPGFPVGAAPLLAGLGPTMILGLPVGGLPGVYHEDEATGQPSPAGTKRSERKQGQVAGELLLALLAGAPSGNRIIPLDRPAVVAVPAPGVPLKVPPAVVAPPPPVASPVAAPIPIPVAPVIVTASPPETQPAPIIIESPVVTGVSPVPAAEEALDAASITAVPAAPAPIEEPVLEPPPESAAPVVPSPVPEPVVQETPAQAMEDPKPPAAIESAIPAEPIVAEQPVAEEPPPVMVEPIPEPEPLPEPVPITIESPVVSDVSPVPEILNPVPEPAAEETPVSGLEAQQPPPVVIESASSLEPISAEQPVVEAPQPEPVPVVETPAQSPPEPQSTEDQAEVASNPITPKLESL